MKKHLIILLVLLITPFILQAQQSVFEYVEGEVTIKRLSGDLIEAQIGDIISVGDSIITGFDGFAELSLENNSKITIDNDTVFVFSQREKEEKKKSIFMVVLGKIGFKFDKLLQEPDIETPATVAGIRGTEFTVVSALDGSTMYIVDEGSVAVEAEGSLIVLQTEEGVEVPLGEVPGEKYEAKVGSVDFSRWLDEGKESFESNPSDVLNNLTTKLNDYASGAEDFYKKWEISFKELNDLDKELSELSEGKDVFYKEKIFPKEISTSYLVLNYRYYALSAYSLRRYVVGNLYIDMKTKYILDNKNETFVDFLSNYENFLRIFEERVVPYLEERDV